MQTYRRTNCEREKSQKYFFNFHDHLELFSFSIPKIKHFLLKLLHDITHIHFRNIVYVGTYTYRIRIRIETSAYTFYLMVNVQDISDIAKIGCYCT